MSLRRFFAAALIVATTASLAIACSVPVFRYALEHWRPDAYTAYVFHEGQLTEDLQEVAQLLNTRAADGTANSNVELTVVDLTSDIAPELQQLRDAHPSEQTPWVVVQSPPKWGPPQTVWQGELNRDHMAVVLDSPARKTVSSRLVDGQSVVWVFLESGDSQEDDAAFTVLTEELKQLESELKLPEIEDEDLKDLSVAADALKIAFSAVRVARDDPAEQAFVEMLLRTEPDLKDADIINQPMAFPVFGRGRALYALVGKGIAPDVIEEASKFLTGACQCTVKAQNPGVDLIMNVNWDKVVITTEPLDEDLPPLAGFSGFGVPDDETTEQPHSAVDKAADTVTTKLAKAPEVAVTLTETPDVAVAAVPDADAAISDALGRNVMLVVMFLLVVTVVATMLFRPKV